MKKLALTLSWLPLFAFGQKATFIGVYEKDRNTINDTSLFIYLGLDSVKVIRSAYKKKGKDLWVQAKTGTWTINHFDSSELEYIALFKFQDGSSDSAVFRPYYNRPDHGRKPDGYNSVDLNGVYIGKRYGGNSSIEGFEKRLTAPQ